MISLGRRVAVIAIAVVLPVASAIVSSFGCAGTTGTKKVAFEAYAGGVAASRLPFTTERGFEVTLTRATLTFGPVYLNVIAPRSATTVEGTRERFSFERYAHAHGEDHLGSGRVVGEVLGQVTIDALSSNLVRFPVPGVVTNESVRTADVWFYPGDGQDPETKRVPAALSIEGVARQSGKVTPFRGALVLDDAWLPEAAAGSREARTLADIRRVRGIATSFVPDEGGRLEIRFDVRPLLRGADFGALESNPTEADGAKRLVQAKATGADQVMTNLFQGLKSSSGPWDVRWMNP